MDFDYTFIREVTNLLYSITPIDDIYEIATDESFHYSESTPYLTIKPHVLDLKPLSPT